MKCIFRLLLLIFMMISLKGLSSQPAEIISAKNFPDHPRLFFLKNAELSLNNNIHQVELLRETHNLIVEESIKMIQYEPLTRNQVGRRILHTSREALRRVVYLSYSYRMTGDKRFAKRALNEMLNVSAFDDWNPSHFLDVAEMTLALAIGYDWLYPQIAPEDKKIIQEAILKKGLSPSNEPTNNSWLTKTNNWNQVCNGGLSAGAAAVLNIYPEESRNIIDRAVKTIPLSMHEYADKGGYPEGAHYWSYGTTYNLLMIDLLEQNFGSDYALSEHTGFLNTADFMLHMEGHFQKSVHGAIPKYFNFGDNREGTTVEPAMFWFASKLKRPDLLFTEARKLQYFLQNDPQKLLNDRFLPFLLLWSIDTDFGAISEPRQHMLVANGKTEVAMMRTSWLDENGIYVGVKAGTPSASHQHMDVGSFIMEADGVRWAIDFGLQEYHSLESKGIDLWNRSQNSQRWEVFRYKNSSHNTLTINDQKQLVAGNATVEKISDAENYMAVAVDLTSIYKHDVSHLRRVVSIIDKQHVQIEDSVQTKEKELKIRWNMLTGAHVEIIDQNTLLLSQQRKKLMLKFSGNVAVTASVRLTKSPNDYDALNEGTVFACFNLTIPANSGCKWQVKLIPTL